MCLCHEGIQKAMSLFQRVCDAFGGREALQQAVRDVGYACSPPVLANWKNRQMGLEIRWKIVRAAAARNIKLPAELFDE